MPRPAGRRPRRGGPATGPPRRPRGGPRRRAVGGRRRSGHRGRIAALGLGLVGPHARRSHGRAGRRAPGVHLLHLGLDGRAQGGLVRKPSAASGGRGRRGGRVGRRPRHLVDPVRPRRLHDEAPLDAGLRPDHAPARTLVGRSRPGAHRPPSDGRGDRRGPPDRPDGPAPVIGGAGLLGRAGGGGRRRPVAPGAGAIGPRALRGAVLDPVLVHGVGRGRPGHRARCRRRRGVPFGGPAPPRRAGRDQER